MTKAQATDHAKYLLEKFVDGYEMMDFTAAHPLRDYANHFYPPAKMVNAAIAELAPGLGFEVVELSPHGFLCLKKVGA